EIALDVVPAKHRVAHRREREAAAVVAIAEVRIGRRLRENAEPAKRIALLVGFQHGRGNRGAAHAVKAVATSDVVAIDPAAYSVLLISHMRPARRERVQLDTRGF